MAENSILILFNQFSVRHTTENISAYTNDVLDKFALNKDHPFITDCTRNMIKLKSDFPLVLCFAHRLNTVISND